MARGIWIVVALIGTVPSAAATEVTVKLVPADPGNVPFVVPLVTSGASCAVVGDTTSLAAVGERVGNEAQVSLFRLDAEGGPAGPATVVKLPRPATLGERKTQPLALALHPTLPLLYVWQDVAGLTGDPAPPVDPAWNDFDHLLIYSLDGPVPELLLGLGRGPRFHTGQTAGSLHLDIAQGRLFVPNLRFGEKNPPDSGGVGWFHLAGDGLPIDGDDDPAGTEPPMAPDAAAVGRSARVEALRAAAAAGKPVGAFRHTPDKTYGFFDRNCGSGFVPVSRDVFIIGGSMGPVTWNRADRGAQAQVFLMPVNFVSYYVTRIAAHPRLPVVFVTIAGYSYAHRIEHAHGYLTLAPQVVLLEGATLRTPPVVLTKRNLVAWGGTGAVYLAHIDATGRFTDEQGMQFNYPGRDVSGVAYSEKFDRLYIAVEKTP